MKIYALPLLLLAFISHTGQASRYAGSPPYVNYEHHMKDFLGYTPYWRAIDQICCGGLANMNECKALVLQPNENFENGTALATARAWAADPAFAGDPKRYARRKIEESDPVAMAARAEAEAAAAEAARLAAEQQEIERQAAEAETARVLEQERQEAERLAAATRGIRSLQVSAGRPSDAASITQDGLSDAVSDHESDRTSPSSASIPDADINKQLLSIRTPAETEKPGGLVSLREYDRAPRPPVSSTPKTSRYARAAEAARTSGRVYPRTLATSSQGTPSTDSTLLTPSPYGASPLSLMSRLGLESPAGKGDTSMLPSGTPSSVVPETDDPLPPTAIGVGASGGPILPRELDVTEKG